jgi:N-acetylmuramoyl-L-alanine amidase
VPTLTVEMFVLSRRDEEKRAGSEAGQERMAKALEAGTLAVLNPTGRK